MGTWTPIAMAGIIALSYLIGWVIRFNIAHAEPLLNTKAPPHLLKSMEFASNLAVFAAYLISVAFYLRVMSAFILRSVDMNTETNANILTSLVLVLICVAGLLRGLKTLELLEEYSVSIKLAIIGAACAGLMWFSLENGSSLPAVAETEFDLDSLRLLGGMLLMVQGFETSRYLGDEYDGPTRIRSMKYAQILAGAIYIGFVLLFMPLLGLVQDVPPEETAIIGMLEHVSFILPIMMIIAATFSQFSAAVADTLSGGGIVREESQGMAPARAGYAIITIGAIILIWQINIFEIVAYASRAFAFYYFTQCLVAIIAARRSDNKNGNSLRITGFTTLALILLWITIYAVPVE
ncbi:hypothetical protein GUA87_10160 [Sneathiella sp. P13V-1]|uniref:hypothetical protein n=1 Tax=Sneathiella sp. P13V-1 TaxID=2697366 RepID=UPI00187B41B7|nr:hypothetical protein [Sneathiella sp. P13V-1]MBE7637207.1 hypothetical protein [Sneathiella sp. P13V-1]